MDTFHAVDSIQSVYLENQCFNAFAACCYTKSTKNNDVGNDNVNVVTKSSDHNGVTSMNCLQKVFHKINHIHMYDKKYENVYVWTDGMWS